MKQLLQPIKGLFSILAVLFVTHAQCLLANAETITVPPGTRVPLMVTNNISSNSIKTSDSINVTIAEDVKVNNQVIFHQGDPASLNVQRARSSGHFGRSGLIELNGGLVTDIKGDKHPINASYNAKGRSRRAFSVTMTILSLPLVLFFIGLVTLPIAVMTSGKDAKVGEGLILDSLTTAPIEVDI